MTKITRFQDIPRFPQAHYAVDVGLDYLKEHIARYTQDSLGGNLQLCPDFQRGHVWTREQQIAFMEFFLRGGETGKNIYLNHPGWMRGWTGEFVLVDGLQRLTAALAFIDNELPVFGSFRHEFTDRIRLTEATFRIHVASLQTRAEVLKWYLDFNSGGTPHDKAEIERVSALLEAEISA